MSTENKALEMIKAVHEDGEAEINGRIYKFTKFTHPLRLQVFSFYSKLAGNIQSGDMSFLTSNDFKPVSKIIENYINFDDMAVSKCKDHWEEYPEDYILFVTTALSVISYPFLKGTVQG